MANDNIEFDIIVNGKKAKKQIEDVEDAQEKFEATTNRTSKNIKTNWIAIGAAVAAAGFAMKKAFDVARDIDVLETKLTVATGSSEQMVEKFAELEVIANELGLSFEDLAESYAKFKIASDLAGTSAEETEKIFKSVSTASAAMKLSADETRGVFKALEQMMSKGTVQAEELRGQLGERLPGAFSLAANAMGVSTAELGKMMEQGELLASDLLPKLADELNNKFAKGAVEASGSIQASYNRLGNVFTDFKGIVLNVLDNIGLIEYFSDAIKVVDKYTSSILRSSKAFADMSKAERQEERLAILNSIKEAEEGIGRAKTNYIFTDISYETASIKAGKARLARLDELDKKISASIKKQKAESEKAVAETAAVNKKFIDKQQKEDDEKAAAKAAKEAEREKAKADRLTDIAQGKYDKLLELQNSFDMEYALSFANEQEAEILRLTEKYSEYEKYVKDKSKLDEWYNNELRKITEETNTELSEAMEFGKSAFIDMGNELANFATTGKADFGSLANSIIQDLIRIQLQQLATSIFGGGGSSAAGGGILSAIGGGISGLFAKGAAFSDGNVTPFANGGVVNSPTVFPMANGMGLMGEAGAEAIMPLTRTSGGDLGVKSSSPVVNVNVQNYGNDEVSVQQNGDNIDIIISRIANDIQRGTGDIGSSIESRYGVRKV